ncbi:MAG: DUF763 domain-containing protein [Myxococcaceae bacterium]
MGVRSGSADLPLHGGRVPEWLASRMARLGKVLVEAIVLEHGRPALLERLSHPFWFQAFGAVMGMDWHSSGITTSVLGALKRGLQPVERELGLTVCGGRGRHSRKTPDELMTLGDKIGLDGVALARSSKLVAKVDSAAVQDGFELYLHGMIVADDGEWIVVQQGMNPSVKTARRYHWRSAGLKDFTDAPHTGIAGESVGEIVNLADRRAAKAKQAQLELVALGPDGALKVLEQARVIAPAVQAQLALPHLVLPAHHDVRAEDVVIRRLHGAIAAAHERAPADFAELLLTPGVGARTVRSLALAAEVVYGAPCRFSDPARFSYAHGGKDGHPFPVPLKVYDRTLATLKKAVEAAKLGNVERLEALKRLDAQSRALESTAEGPGWDQLLTTERAESHRYAGRTVMGWAKPPG